MASSLIEIPKYDTVIALVVEDSNGICLDFATDVMVQGEPIYLYQERDTYIDRIDEYFQDKETGRVYVNDIKFVVGDTVSVDIEKAKVKLLKYVFN